MRPSDRISNRPVKVVATALSERAPAKVNLTLTVLGRRPDGYHELESLVAFADAGASDQVTLEPGGPLRLEVAGPGAESLEGENAKRNLVLRAAEAALRAREGLISGTFRLEKRLPIAAGLGGGSADAAAALRLMRRANPAVESEIDWHAIAASIGADVPVCLDSRVAMMRGIGERVSPLIGLPPAWLVLANPRVPLPTAAVFKALNAGPAEPRTTPSEVPRFACQAELIDYVRSGRNDLEATAAALCPEVANVSVALGRLPGAVLVRMSGSGPTVFGLFATSHEANEAAGLLRRDQPRWWIEAARLS